MRDNVILEPKVPLKVPESWFPLNVSVPVAVELPLLVSVNVTELRVPPLAEALNCPAVVPETHSPLTLLPCSYRVIESVLVAPEGKLVQVPE